jgi:hypothetical protein
VEEEEVKDWMKRTQQTMLCVQAMEVVVVVVD